MPAGADCSNLFVINGLEIASGGGVLFAALPLECFGFGGRLFNGRFLFWGIRLSKNVRHDCRRNFLEDVARGVEFDVGGAEAGDSFFSATFCRSEVDEEDLVFFGVDYGFQFFFEFNFVGGAEVAFEYGVLEVVAVVAAGFVNLAQAFGVADVVGDDVGGQHG